MSTACSLTFTTGTALLHRAADDQVFDNDQCVLGRWSCNYNMLIVGPEDSPLIEINGGSSIQAVAFAANGVQCPRWMLYSYESCRVGREIDAFDVVVILRAVRDDFFERFCVPHEHIAVDCSRCDPSAVRGHSETPHILRFHSCHLFPVFHSPYSNSLVTAADEMLPANEYKHSATGFW